MGATSFQVPGIHSTPAHPSWHLWASAQAVSPYPPLLSLPCAPAHMTLGKCPYSARWLPWGLPSPEQISGICAAFLAGRPQVSPTAPPCSVGQTPRGLTEDWHALAKTAAQVSQEPPRASPGVEGKGQQVALPGFALPGSYLEQVPAGGRVSWLSVGRLCFRLLWALLFCLRHHHSCCLWRPPVVPHVSRGVPLLSCSILPPPSCFTD